MRGRHPVLIKGKPVVNCLCNVDAVMEMQNHIEDNELIVKFLQGGCTELEQDFILKEAARNPEFKQMLVELKNIYVHENMTEQSASDSEYAAFKRYAVERMLLEEPEKWAENDENRRVMDKKRISGMVTRIAAWSAAAIILVLLSLNLRYWHLESDKNNAAVAEVPVSTLPVEAVNTLYTSKGVKGEIILPDSSKVILNSDSRIKYPAKFTGSTRDIEFSGEGYFEVKKDSLHPMVVRCNKNFKVVVYGTTFNIKTYNNDNNAKTTLISGSIKIVENIDGKEFIRDVAPNQTYTIEENRQLATLEKEVDTEKVCQWKDGILAFDSTPLGEVAKILERWHGLQIVINNGNMLDIPITARFTTESIVQIMDLLKFSTNLKYDIKDNVVTVE